MERAEAERKKDAANLKSRYIIELFFFFNIAKRNQLYVFYVEKRAKQSCLLIPLIALQKIWIIFSSNKCMYIL